MSDGELIDRLCGVTTRLADIVRRQAEYIEQLDTVDEAIKAEFVGEREQAERELDVIEYGLRVPHGNGKMERGVNL